MSEENYVDMSWNNDKELAILISCIKSPLWIEGQEDFNIKCHIREFLQKCSGGKIVKMLKNVLSTEEKSGLVKNELETFFQTQAQSFQNYMKVKQEPDFCDQPRLLIKTEPISEESITFHSKFSAAQPSKYICQLKNQGNRNICAKSFETEADFNEHRQVHFSKLYRCEICGNVFAYKRIMQRHILTFHSKKNKCLKRGYSVYNSKLHNKKKRSKASNSFSSKSKKDENENLKLGDGKAEDKENLKIPPKDPTQQPESEPNRKDESAVETRQILFNCKNCDFETTEKDDLKTHMETLHKVIKAFKCSICNYETSRNDILKIHVACVHEGIKRSWFNCNICNYKSAVKSNLNKHMKSVHGKNKAFKCNICNFQVAAECHLKRHIENVHERIKPFKCKLCDYETATNFHLKRHIDSVHEGLKPFKCNKCEYKTSLKDSLKKHIEIVHEGMKPFKCKLCDYECAQKGQLKTHIASVHEGIKPFKCNICEFKTAQKHNLKNHIERVHKGKKPFK